MEGEPEMRSQMRERLLVWLVDGRMPVRAGEGCCAMAGDRGLLTSSFGQVGR